MRREDSPRRSFNGATRYRVWKEARYDTRKIAAPRASTEPHAIACGKAAYSDPHRPGSRGFNGATRYRVWKVRAATPIVAAIMRLQRSHTLSRVERFRVRTCWSWLRRLQRSHTLSRVESCPDGAMDESRIFASTEPHAIACGKLIPCKSFRFHASRASTEPHAIACGKRIEEPAIVFLLKRLQRSHTLSRVERSSSDTNCLDMSSFNGATRYRVWKGIRPRRHPASTSRFNGATRYRVWKEKAGARYRQRRRRFNGATRYRVWKGGRDVPLV